MAENDAVKSNLDTVAVRLKPPRAGSSLSARGPLRAVASGGPVIVDRCAAQNQVVRMYQRGIGSHSRLAPHLVEELPRCSDERIMGPVIIPDRWRSQLIARIRFREASRQWRDATRLRGVASSVVIQNRRDPLYTCTHVGARCSVHWRPGLGVGCLYRIALPRDSYSSTHTGRVSRERRRSPGRTREIGI